MRQRDIDFSEYQALRTEICQSISKQHHILLSGYGLSVTLIGYAIGKSGFNMESLAVVPMILVSMVSIWLVECNRMVRASYYIAFVLWRRLSLRSGWEAWIREGKGGQGDFKCKQDVLQRIAVAYVPFLVSVAAMAVSASQDKKVWLILYGIIIMGIWIWLYAFHIRKISDLAAIPKPEEAESSA